jgi:schlafen family protein
MNFWTTPLQGLTEEHVQALVAERAHEGLRLEFKQRMDLSSREQKKEAAKDLVALANATGGRIIYGIEEAADDDGPIAARVMPLSDPKVSGQYSDVIHSAVHPRIRFDMASVAVAGGFVIIVEVPPPLVGDLHLVTGYGENRFYRRGPSGAVPMTEPEIRDTYGRGAAMRAQLESEMKAVSDRETSIRVTTDESILIIPWHLRATLVEPSRMPQSVGAHLAQHALPRSELRDYLGAFTLRHDGYIATIPHDSSEDTADYMLAIRKNGVVHTSTNAAARKLDDGMRWFPLDAIERILEAFSIAKTVFSVVGYWGPVRLEYHLRLTEPWHIGGSFGYNETPISARPLMSVVEQADLVALQGNWGILAKDLIDDIFHAGHRAASPYFTEDGMLVATALGRGPLADRILARIRPWVRVSE